MPFTAEQFFEVFARYNQTVFPLQFFLILAACLTVFLAIYHKPRFDVIISGVLAFLWLWAGIVYQLSFFTEINSGAYLFGLGFVAQGLFFFYEGIFRKRLNFRLEPGIYGVVGAIIVIYALILYPIIGTASGHFYPASPTFGAPCPTTIFTFGLLVWTNKKLPLHLLIIPLLWSVIGSTAAWHFGVVEDYGLGLTAAAAIIFILQRYFTLNEEVLI